MALAQYSQKFWFPSGALAPGVVARVFLHSTNTLAALWTDATGTVPVPNPTVTDANAFLTFWAEEGTYWLHLDTESFEIQIGAGQQAATQQDIADAVEPMGLDTGVLFGGELNANLLNPLALDIGDTLGFIVDYITTPETPTITRVVIPAQTVALTDVVSVVTWWMADSAGNIVQQSTKPTNTQRRTHIQLGATAQTGGAIFVDQSLPVIIPQPVNQLYDLMYALGAFNISGNILAAAGANLQLTKSSGDVFTVGFNHFAGPVLTNDPHVSSVAAQNPVSMRYVTRVLGPLVPTVTSVDVANYDNAGVITPIGGGAGRATIQRVFLFPVNDVADQIVVQYGQTIYSNITDAVAAVGAETFAVNPTLADGVLLGFIVATRTATDLSNTAQARVIMAGKFGSSPGGSSSVALHAATHAAAGSDPVTLSQSQITGLATSLADAVTTAETYTDAQIAALSALTQLKLKTADETRTSVITVSDDLHLFAPLEANSTYRFRSTLLFDGPEAADATITFTVPAGATGGWAPVAGTLGTTVPDGSASIKVAARQFASNSDIGVMASSATLAGIVARPEGIVTTGATPGNLRLRWAQQTSNVTAVTLKAGSTLEVIKTSGSGPSASGINLDYPGNYPSDQGLLAWTYDPDGAGHVTAQSNAGVAGRVTLTKIQIRKSITWSRIHFGLSGVDGAAVLANCYLGVYNSAGVRVGVTADISADFSSGATAKSVPLGAAFTAAPGAYFIALLLNGTWTTNSFTLKCSGAGISVNDNLTAPNLRYSNMLTGQTSLPANLDLTQQVTTIINTGWGSQYYGVS